MFTLQDISSGELFQKVALAITPKEEQQDFIADICLVYDELAKLSYTQMKLNQFTRTKSVLHPVIEDCFELILKTILLIGAQNSPHVLVRPSLVTVLRSRNHV